MSATTTGEPRALVAESDSQVLTIEEVAAVLRLDPTTVYRHIRQGTFPMPVLTIGRRRRVAKNVLARYLDGTLGTAS